MSKIVKAQNGLSFAIPIIRTLSQVFPRIGVLPGIFSQPKEVVGEKELNNAFRTYALKKSQELEKKSVERFTVPRTTSDEQSDATRVFRPVVMPTRRDINLHLGETRAIPVYGKQSGTSTPVMGKKKKARKARPIITRTPDAESTSVTVGSGAIAGSEDAAQRDTVRVTNGAAVENATPQDTVNVQHKNDKNTEQTIDDRNILQRLGDRWARRKRQNNSTTNPENKPPRKWWDKTKTGLKWGMYGFVANEADNKIFSGGVKKIVKGVLDLGFDKPDTVYIKKPNNAQRLQTTINTPEQVIGYPTESDYR